MNLLKNMISILGAAYLVSQTAFAEPVIVQMRSISFYPKIVEINEGDAIVWSNVSYTDHSATSNDAESFDTDMIVPGSSSEPVIFSKVGSFMFHCKLHGRTMSGKVIVKPLSALPQ